jgi:hypothetical protein
MGHHAGYYAKEIIRLEKEIHTRQGQLQALQRVNDGLRWVSADVTHSCSLCPADHSVYVLLRKPNLCDVAVCSRVAALAVSSVHGL